MMKRNIEHAWTTATLIATAALAIALAIAAILFTRATTTNEPPPPQSRRLAPEAPSRGMAPARGVSRGDPLAETVSSTYT